MDNTLIDESGEDSWMSKNLKAVGPSAEELLLQGEWIWSQDGSE
jgi:hypothetical protein